MGEALGWYQCMFHAWYPQNMPMLCPPEYMVCFLHRLISALRYYWDEYKASNPHASFSEGEWHWGPRSVRLDRARRKVAPNVSAELRLGPVGSCPQHPAWLSPTQPQVASPLGQQEPCTPGLPIPC